LVPAVVALLVLAASIAQADPPRGGQRAAKQPAVAAGTNDVWQVMYIGKARIGYSHTLSRPVTVEGRSLVRTDAETHLTIKRFGQTLQMETRQETEELPSGELQSFVFEIKNPPAAPTRTVAHVRGNVLTGETTVAGTPHEISLPWDPATKSPAFVDRYPHLHPLKPGDAANLRVFVPEQMQTSDVRFRALRRETVAEFNGRRRSLLRVSLTESIMPQSPTEVYLDEQGEGVVSTTEMLGQTLTTYIVPAEEALKQIAGEGLDLAVNTLVKSTAIPKAHFTTRAVYRIKMHGEDPTPFFVNDANQKVIRTGPDECEITVRNVRPVPSNRSTRADRQYLDPSRFLQSNDREVLNHVDRAARNIVEPSQIAVAMEKYVDREMQKKDFSTALASAAEVARTLQGDCTEHAALLAAMLRARNIPSKIAVGLVYVEPLSAFGGHMWTEALIGDHWVPLDATLGNGEAGIGAAHIKLAESSFADNAASPMTSFLPLLRVLGRIELTVVETSGQ
jgi:Transglutaminase-like superfamily